VQRQLLEFRLSGVDKDDATRAKLKKLQDKLTEDQAMFERNISDDQKSVMVANASELDGLPQDYIDNHKPGADGKIKITTNYPDLFPVLEYAESDALRRRMWEAWNTRAYPKNRDVLIDMMQTRYQIATLIGYSSWADYNAADKMMQNGRQHREVHCGPQHGGASGSGTRVCDVAGRETEDRSESNGNPELRRFPAARTGPPFAIRLQLGKCSSLPALPASEAGHAGYGRDPLPRHLPPGMNAPSWDPAVETWDVIDNGKMIGRFYLDMHPRPGKYSHAEMAAVLDGVRGKQLPEAILICNFAEPTATDPGLMNYGDAVTFFHEFGHLMHHILGGQQQWAGISGITMESDFVEAPSQMLEEWMQSPQVLATFARNYKTGEPIPPELVARMNRASAFGRANRVSLQNALSAISYDLYKDDPAKIDVDAVVPRFPAIHVVRSDTV
jgi:thimet oligopeptidase